MVHLSKTEGADSKGSTSALSRYKRGVEVVDLAKDPNPGGPLARSTTPKLKRDEAPERIHRKYTVEPQNFAPESAVSQIADHWSKECVARCRPDLLVFVSTHGLTK